MTFQQALQRHLTAIQEHDIDTFLETIVADGTLSLILPNGDYLDDYQEIVELHQEWFADPEWRMTTELITQHESDAMASALLLVNYEDVDEEGEAVQFQYFLNLIFVKQGDQWLVVHDQNTMIELTDEDGDES
ncbi:MAG: nuclear transport factor 2 family protein [Caldilineaceae bacterium]